MLDKPFQKCYNNNVKRELTKVDRKKIIEKWLDKLFTICYNNNVNKNKSKKEMRYLVWKRK